MALISNISLLTVEALTGEPNEKEPTFNKEPSPDNDEGETILIGDLCVLKASVVIIYTRYRWKPELKKNENGY